MNWEDLWNQGHYIDGSIQNLGNNSYGIAYGDNSVFKMDPNELVWLHQNHPEVFNQSSPWTDAQKLAAYNKGLIGGSTGGGPTTYGSGYGNAITAANNSRDDALGALAALNHNRDVSLGQLEKAYQNQLRDLAAQLAAQERLYKDQTYGNSQDWRTGENSALQAGSDFYRNTSDQLANQGVVGGSSAIKDVFNKAQDEFYKDQSQTNYNYGKAQQKSDYDIATERDENRINQNKAWNDWMTNRNKELESYQSEAQRIYNQALAADESLAGYGSGSHRDEDLAGRNSLQGPEGFDYRDTAQSVIPTNPIAKYAKMGKIDVTSEAKQGRAPRKAPAAGVGGGTDE